MSGCTQAFHFFSYGIHLQKNILLCNFNPQFLWPYIIFLHCIVDTAFNISQQRMCCKIDRDFKRGMIPALYFLNCMTYSIHDIVFKFRQNSTILCQINDQWRINHTIYRMIPSQICLRSHTFAVGIYLWLIQHIQFSFLYRTLQFLQKCSGNNTDRISL